MKQKLKKSFNKNQNKLHSNLEVLEKELEIFSDKLFDYYEEHKEVNKRISELDFESDKDKEKQIKQKVSETNHYGKNIKTAIRLKKSCIVAAENALLNSSPFVICPNDINVLVTVVPMFAPITIKTALVGVIIAPPAIATIKDVVVEEL